MFSKLLKRKPQVRAPETPSVPDGVVVWAIGDIHGRLDLLVPLVEAIQTDATASDAARKVVIFLGDYIDRGPESRGVIQYLAALPADAGIEWRFLKGNHEETMLEFLEDPSVGARWCEYGGDATLASYGLKLPAMRHRAEPWAHLSADLESKLTAEQQQWLESLELTVTVGDYFFCHAGARPGIELTSQSAEDLMWIRRTFLDDPAPFERIVVHGHTPTREPHLDHRRVGVDTKAYASGRLTAVRLMKTERRFVEAYEGDGTVAVRHLAPDEGVAA